jgi:Reverse transcriptase (RNA-dependent DNA polymerase)
MVTASWKPRSKDLKRYPHFDSYISAAEAEALANDPQQVERHTFYPFMLFHNRWNKFAPKGQKGKPKERPIRYAARADAYIFARYRYQLSELYETKLQSLNLGGNILAYRRIVDSQGSGGKCNIHFARDAFCKIISLQLCCTISLDISSFFENLDHDLLKSEWCSLLGVERLPADHFHVFRSITNYAFVEKEQVYERLGHFGLKIPDLGGKPRKGYLTPKKEMRLRLCSGNEFREKIAGGDGRPSIIRKHKKSRGIPQGAPISDLLANIYLLGFDVEMEKLSHDISGQYFRYSDDILLIAPVNALEAIHIEKLVRQKIESYGTHLRIKQEKSSIIRFWPEDNHQAFEVVFDGQSAQEKARAKREELAARGDNTFGPAANRAIQEAFDQGRKTLNGFEYLGFRFDGRNVYVRDSTLANLWRKISAGIQRETSKFVNANPSLELSELKAQFKKRHEVLVKAYGRVEDFKESRENHKNWTFWTYAQKSAKVFGPLGTHILNQLKGHRRKIVAKADVALERAFIKKKNSQASL